MEGNITDRLGYIDVAKGIGILCVMLGHFGIQAIDKVVFTFHMPLFFLISGYFINDNVSIWEFVKRKISRLLVPYYVTGVSICFLLILADIVRGLWNQIPIDFWNIIIAILYGSCLDVTKQIHGIGAIWFLWALFWSTLMVRIFCKLKWRGAIWIWVLALASYLTSLFIWLPLSIQQGGCAAIFVYFGWKLKQIDLKKYIKNIWLMLFAFGVFVLQILFDIRVDMAKNTYDLGVVSVLGAVIICFLVLCVSNIICSTRMPIISRVLCFWGKYSLIMLCFHQIEMRVFPWSIVTYILKSMEMTRWFNCVAIPIRIVLCTVCTGIFVYIMKRFKQKTRLLNA